MIFCRLILCDWAQEEQPSKVRAFERQFTTKELIKFNKQGYNVYYFPNYPSEYPHKRSVDGTDIDTFEWVFVDCDLKDGKYASKEDFIAALGQFDLLPTKIVDSGRGVHAYWRVHNLDAMAFLRFQRRLARRFDTDLAVGKLAQLMRLPGTINPKDKSNPVLCELLHETDSSFTAEELDLALPPIAIEDEAVSQNHFDKTFALKQDESPIPDKLPAKFGRLLRNSSETKDLWAGNVEDRSKADYRLGHLLFSNNFTKTEALTVLANTAKALQRAPIHRRNYAQDIINKVWTFENQGPEDTIEETPLSASVFDILSAKDDESLKGTRFPCLRYFDGTEHGFRIGQVIGLCAGVGVGKTAISLNIFKGFVELNPNFIHMFVSLEQPAREIAGRWKKMVGDNTALHNKVHILSNYNEDGSYRNLSLTEIQDYIVQFQKDSEVQVGCVCLDHIGVLRQEKRPGEFQGLGDICAKLKAFAIATETLFIIQSQTSREKSGIGDLELDKGSAYGTQNFEAYLDFLMVAWQPLKRCYGNPACPRVTAYKFAKVRFKSKKDFLLEDECYRLLFDPDTETLRPMTQIEEKAFKFYDDQARKLRGKDRKTDAVTYTSVRWDDNVKGEVADEPESDSDRQSPRH